MVLFIKKNNLSGMTNKTKKKKCSICRFSFINFLFFFSNSAAPMVPILDLRTCTCETNYTFTKEMSQI